MRYRDGFVLACAVVILSLALAPALAFAAHSIDDVKGLIDALPSDPATYQLNDREAVEAARIAYDSLGEADRARLETESGKGSVQPYARLLESAEWAIASLSAPDNSTSLPDGTYTSRSTPALSYEFNSGKSTSGKASWSVESVTVANGKAFAVLAVSSKNYPYIVTGGKRYDKASGSGNCRFENVPIDLNSTFYFSGVTTAMSDAHGIAYSMTTAIAEPDASTHVMSVNCPLKTFNANGTAVLGADIGRIIAGKRTDTYDFQLGVADSLYDQVVYLSTIDGQLAEAAASSQNGAFQIVLVNVEGVEPALTSGKAMNMKFRIALTGEWVDRQVTIDLDAETVEISGSELGLATVKAMIGKLPTDPWKVADRDAEAIGLTEVAYGALSSADRKELDNASLGRQSYGRALEQAIWALKALASIDSSTTLADGEYTGKVKSSSSMGKSASPRNNTFTVQKVIVQDGKATALIKYSGTSADQVLTGGQVYRHVNTDEEQPSQFEVPIKLNETLYLVEYAKNPTENTVGITYKLDTEASESQMKPDPAAPQGGDEGDGEGDGEGGGEDAPEQGGQQGGQPTGQPVSSPRSSALSRLAAPSASASSPSPNAVASARPDSHVDRDGVSEQSGESASDDELSSDMLFALTVLLVVCPLVVLVAGAALFALWFARREMAPLSSVVPRLG